MKRARASASIGRSDVTANVVPAPSKLTAKGAKKAPVKSEFAAGALEITADGVFPPRVQQVIDALVAARVRRLRAPATSEAVAPEHDRAVEEAQVQP